LKKKILIFTAYYSPAVKGGGPIQSIRNLTDNLSDYFEFYIITGDRDLGDDSPFENISPNRWTIVENSKVLYVNKKKLELGKLIDVVKQIDFDLIYLNSFFSFKFSILPLLLTKFKVIASKPVLLAPRGEFSQGALNLKKGKKRVYIYLVKLLRTYKSVYWHATAREEENDIKRTINNDAYIRVASNLTADYSELKYTKSIKKVEGHLKIIFLSRIHPKKNLLQAIKLMKNLTGNVEFSIYGPIEDSNYWDKCNDAILDLPDNISIQYKGVISHENIINTFNKHHIFLFPTLGENFGHVISEALIGGCPLIISDQTPWRNLEQSGVGFDINLSNNEEFMRRLQFFVNMNNSEFELYSKNAFNYVKNYAKNSESSFNMKNIFEDLL
jgi:glycosyltransferase involved in cell wall biosynthesis